MSKEDKTLWTFLSIISVSLILSGISLAQIEEFNLSNDNLEVSDKEIIIEQKREEDIRSGNILKKIEDKENGVVCYVGFNCVKI